MTAMKTGKSHSLPIPTDRSVWWYWGRRFAREAARAPVADGPTRIDLEEIVPFTVPANVRSTRVMERLGLTHDPADDFDHPRLAVGHRLHRHVLFRRKRSDWEAANEERPGDLTCTAFM